MSSGWWKGWSVVRRSCHWKALNIIFSTSANLSCCLKTPKEWVQSCFSDRQWLTEASRVNGLGKCLVMLRWRWLRGLVMSWCHWVEEAQRGGPQTTFVLATDHLDKSPGGYPGNIFWMPSRTLLKYSLWVDSHVTSPASLWINIVYEYWCNRGAICCLQWPEIAMSK